MTSQTEAQISARSEQEEEFEISKSQLKRDSKDLQKLGKKLAALNPEQLASVPLDESLRDAIELAHKLSNKRGALKRHFQFIGKLLRGIDVEPVQAAVRRIEDSDHHSKQYFKTLEYWRDQILQQGDRAINECCEQYGGVERQTLRQLSRNYRNADSEERKTRFARQIFKQLQSGIDES